jgi:4-hydroxythreonine-4-phosphate dehydrogenase
VLSHVERKYLMRNSWRSVAITLGDAAGIGPEIVVKTCTDKAFISQHPAFVIGDVSVVQRHAKQLTPQLKVRKINRVEDHQFQAGTIDVLSVSDLPADLIMGKVSAAAGQAAFDAIKLAIELANQRKISAICTAPIHKEALFAAGVPFPGHTEMLAEFSSTQDYAMMLANPQLRTILVTVHCSVLDAVKKLSIPLELRIIRLAHRSLQSMGIAKPRIAVAGLNPHAGEGGLFGREDMDIMAPAIAQARAEGIDATGPHPGDTVFMNARKGKYDIVVAQYHDQGLIPVKLLGVEDGVNITAGLPFVRTSPDHGTAFDIAGKGIADPASMKTALATAHQLVKSSIR